MKGWRIRHHSWPWRWAVISDGYLTDVALTRRAALRRRGAPRKWATVIPHKRFMAQAR